jgi:hypothetical protein
MGRPRQQRIKISDDLLVVARIGASPPKMESPKLRRWDEVISAVNNLTMVKKTSPWMELRGFPNMQELHHCKSQLAVHHSKRSLKGAKSFRLKITHRHNNSGGYSLWLRKERRSAR